MTRAARPNPPLVSVRWRDAHATATALYEIHELPHAATEITTYGLLLREDATGVSIASEACGAETYRGVTFIPRELIVECRPVQRRRASRPRATASPEVSA
jgi:hypothetical protein